MQQESYENAQICYICKEKFENKYLKDKKYETGLAWPAALKRLR